MIGLSLSVSRSACPIPPALDLNFLNVAMPAGLTFTRASTAWAYNSSGVLTSFATNAPRLDHDPVTLLPTGLLVEEARTNLFLNSAVGVTQSCTVAAAANTLSFFGTGTVALTGTSTAGPLVGTGAANRVSLTFTPTAGSLTLTVSGSCTNVQLELGAFASSPIVTAGSTATRAADVCTMPIGSWFNTAQGAVFAELSTLDTTGNLNAGGWLLSDGTSNNRILLRVRNSANAQALVVTGGVTQISLREPGALPTGQTVRCGVAWAANSVSFARDGAVPLTTSSTTVPTGLTELRLGNSHPTGGEALNGHLRRLAYHDRRLPDASLQVMTS